MLKENHDAGSALIDVSRALSFVSQYINITFFAVQFLKLREMLETA
jgi:hypothetical protein